MAYDYSPRDIQILALLILYKTQDSMGRLVQINTSEGKTIIIAMLAIIKVLEGHKVDIITSSTELARPQSKQQEKFFSLFGISIIHNCPEDLQDTKERYKSDVVYGSAGNFQGDLLRDEFSKLGTRSNRKYDVAIIDEVDSMLIDDKSHIVMLSTTIPGMEFLEPLLASIWCQIERISSQIFTKDNKTSYISTDESNYAQIDETRENFIKRCIGEHVRKLIRCKDVNKEYPKIDVPKHLWEFVCNQIDNWINSAICAKYNYELNKQYILEGTKILPVDSSNTGVVQQNMHWNNALHQFLQFKHGVKITPEGLTTNYISNVSFFQRYGSNIFGLTGTLGSEASQKLLSKTFNVDIIIIPSYRIKQYK